MILQARFGELPMPVKEHMTTIKARAQLEHLLKIAATVDSLANFEVELKHQHRNFDQ